MKNKSVQNTLSSDIRFAEESDSVILEGNVSVNVKQKVLAMIGMACWTVVCTVIPCFIFTAKGDMPFWGRVIFLAFFEGSWLFLIPALLRQNWYWEQLRIDGFEAVYRTGIRVCGVFLPLSRRRVPLGEIGPAMLIRWRDGSCSGSELTIPTTSLPIKCFNRFGKKSPVESFLAPLNKRLKELGVRKTDRLRYDFDAEPFRWTLHEDGSSRRYFRNGYVSARGMTGIVVAGLFFSVFVVVLGAVLYNSWYNREYFGPAIIVLGFWIPITSLAIWCYALFPLAILQRLCRYEISIGVDGVGYRRSWLGIEKKSFWRYDDFADAVVQYRQTRFLHLDMLRNPELAETPDGGRTNPFPYIVQLNDAHGKAIGQINDLLENEAKQIARKIRKFLIQPELRAPG